MPQPALPQVPGYGPCPMARATAGRAVARSLLPRGVYLAAADRPAGASEREDDLQPPLPRRFPDLTGNRRRPAVTGCIHRLSGGAAHLGSESTSAPASALRRAGRRHLPGWLPLDRLPQVHLLSPRARAQQPVSQEVLGPTRTSVSRRRAAPLRGTPSSGRAGCVPSTV